MAVSENTGGTLTTDGTEQTLATIASAGTYQLLVELNGMGLTDEVEIKLYVKARSGSTSRVVWDQIYKFVQADAVIISPPVPAPFEFKATLKRNAGSVTSIIWSIYQY